MHLTIYQDTEIIHKLRIASLKCDKFFFYRDICIIAIKCIETTAAKGEIEFLCQIMREISI